MTTYEYFLMKNTNNTEKNAMCIRLDSGGVHSYTYGQLFALADVFADALRQAEIEPGDRVAVIAENCPEWCAAYLAVSKARAAAVLIDASLEQSELIKLVEKSKVRCIFTTRKIIGKIELFLNIPALDISNNAQYFDGYDCRICAEKPDCCAENVSVIIFSSGTTKTASGIMHSHESLLNTTMMVIKNCNMHTDERFLAILPNSRIYGLICQVIGSMTLESSICFLESLNADSLNGAFQEYKPTVFPAVPKVFELLKTQIMRKINSDDKTKSCLKHFSLNVLRCERKQELTWERCCSRLFIRASAQA